jgi:hypothetical protein
MLVPERRVFKAGTGQTILRISGPICCRNYAVFSSRSAFGEGWEKGLKIEWLQIRTLCDGVESMVEFLRSRIQKNGTVPATCPSCGAVRRYPSEAFGARNAVEVKCSCGNSFSLLAEFRKAYRRRVNLSGAYARRSFGQEDQSMRIENLSMTGAGLAVGGKHGLAQGDELALRIVFDKGDYSELEVAAEVVYLRDGYAGCRFKDLSPDQEEVLASYLVLIP